MPCWSLAGSPQGATVPFKGWAFSVEFWLLLTWSIVTPWANPLLSHFYFYVKVVIIELYHMSSSVCIEIILISPFHGAMCTSKLAVKPWRNVYKHAAFFGQVFEAMKKLTFTSELFCPQNLLVSQFDRRQGQAMGKNERREKYKAFCLTGI